MEVSFFSYQLGMILKQYFEAWMGCRLAVGWSTTVLKALE
jgi:hypothetical protein